MCAVLCLLSIRCCLSFFVVTLSVMTLCLPSLALCLRSGGRSSNVNVAPSSSVLSALLSPIRSDVMLQLGRQQALLFFFFFFVFLFFCFICAYRWWFASGSAGVDVYCGELLNGRLSLEGLQGCVFCIWGCGFCGLRLCIPICVHAIS